MKNQKGMTLIEVILSLAILGIVSAPLLTIFAGSAAIVKKTDERIEINAVSRIIKENVTNSVKYGVGNVLHMTDGTPVDLQTAGDGHDLVIEENGEKNGSYKFDAIRIRDYSGIEYNLDHTTYSMTNTCEYSITIKRLDDSSEVEKIILLINNLGPNP